MTKIKESFKNFFNFNGFKTDAEVVQERHVNEILDEAKFQERYKKINQREQDVLSEIIKHYGGNKK